MKSILIIHEPIASDASLDSIDTLLQVEAVEKACKELGYSVQRMTFTFDLLHNAQQLEMFKPYCVVNLVESFMGKSNLMHTSPALCENYSIPFTGNSSIALHTTTHKVFSKILMHHAGISTPQWGELKDLSSDMCIPFPCIVKPIAEDASMGIDDASICRNFSELQNKIESIPRSQRSAWFAEEFVDGREFNVSLLGDGKNVVVLPIAEMVFAEFPADKPRIVNYKAKWDRMSFEFHHTIRSFDFSSNDQILLTNLENVVKKCWQIFGLRGYARVDLRTTSEGIPCVIEVNANPAITPDSGFVAAAARAGLTFKEMIARIIEQAFV